MQFFAFLCSAVSLLITLTMLKNALFGEEKSSNLRLFLEIGLPLLGVAAACFAVAFSIWRKAPWSRHLLIAFLATGAICQIWVAPRSSLALNLGIFSVNTRIPTGLTILGAAIWYLYWKANVKDYYAGLVSKPEERLAAQSVEHLPTVPKRPDDRPWLVKVVPRFALFIGVNWGLYAALIALAGVLPREWISATFGVETSLTAALPWAGAALVAFLIAYTFWRRILWCRHLLVSSLTIETVRQHVWQSEVVQRAPLIIVAPGILSMVIWLGLLSWYFYLKPNVRAYFRRLESRRDESFELPPATLT